MAVSTGDITTRISNVALQAIESVAKRDNIPERLVKKMKFRMDCHYSMEKCVFHLRCAWNDPADGNHVRNLTIQISDWMYKHREHELYDEVVMTIDSINLRGELFFFKLHKHFPNYIEKVRCDKEGRVYVQFKNGRELSVDQQDLDSTEFLATCGMVYDL